MDQLLFWLSAIMTEHGDLAMLLDLQHLINCGPDQCIGGE